MSDRYDIVYDEDRQETVIKDKYENKVLDDIEIVTLLVKYDDLITHIKGIQELLK